MRFLVLGATGTVGSNVVRELLARGQQVRVLTRDPARARALGPDVEFLKGDLLDPATLRGLYDGTDGAFVVNPVSQTEASEGLMAVSAAMDSGLKRLVYLSVQHADRAPHLPHFGSKLGVEAAVRAARLDWTILRPSNFFQNDHWFRDAILQYGVYPQPLGDVGVSRVDVRDIAELAAIALTQEGHAGKTYDVVGPRALTGAETAEVWSAALGRKVAYAGDDLEAWEKQSLQYLPAWMVYDFKLMYRHFQQNGLRGTPADTATLTRVLGHAPRRFEDFATETAKIWTREGAAAAQR
ncbi:MAG: NmrA family NAD(P)-binding protein [Candidatus Eisenbacteria bacterium]|nr:NmrA family NAD(P)-binding protein [Candidatus Eisenbacteria bacterium]